MEDAVEEALAAEDQLVKIENEDLVGFGIVPRKRSR